jgi:hypothetical protein
MKSSNIEKCEDLANAARPINDADWGADRQIEAENKLFAFVRTVLDEEDFERVQVLCQEKFPFMLRIVFSSGWPQFLSKDFDRDLDFSAVFGGTVGFRGTLFGRH